MDNRLRFGIVVGLASFAVETLVSTLVFPLLLKHLGKTDAGLWMLFSSLGSLLGCLLSGLAPATSRYVATIAGKHGIGTDGQDPMVWALVKGALARVYALAILIGVVVGVLLIPFYLKGVGEAGGRSILFIAATWCGYLVGWSARGLIQRNFSTLDGLGEVGFNRVVNTFGGITNLVLLMWLLPKGVGVWAPVLSYVAVSCGVCIISWLLLRRKAPQGWAQPASVSWQDSNYLMKDALSMFVLGVSSYVVGQSCILFVERGAGVATLATFAPIARVVVLLAGAACLPNSMLMPFIARAYNAGEKSKFRGLVLTVLFLAPMLYIIPASILAIFCRDIFGWWLGADNFLGEAPTRLLLTYGLVYTVHCSVAVPALALRHQSFVFESILNMVLVIVFMPLFSNFLGINGYPLGMIAGTVIPSMIVCWKSLTFIRQRLA